MAIYRDKLGRAVYGVIDEAPAKNDTKKHEPAETPDPKPKKGE
jgi:hypothetical protein